VAVEAHPPCTHSTEGQTAGLGRVLPLQEVRRDIPISARVLSLQAIYKKLLPVYLYPMCADDAEGEDEGNEGGKPMTAAHPNLLKIRLQDLFQRESLW